MDLFHPSVKLVPVSSLAVLRGVSDETAIEMAECLQWVFNIAPRPNYKRELRIWVREIKEPQAVLNFTPDQVIDEIFPRRPALPGVWGGFSNGDIGRVLRVSRKTMIALRGELAAVSRPDRGGEIWVKRESLVRFLKRRLIGAYFPAKGDPFESGVRVKPHQKPAICK